MRQGAEVRMSRTANHPRADAARAEGVDERELIERVRGRELAAFERLYRLYQPRLTRFLSNVVQRPQVLEEVVDDTMMVVWETAGTFRGASKLSTWSRRTRAKIARATSPHRTSSFSTTGSMTP